MNRLTYIKRHLTEKEQAYLFYQLDLLFRRMALNADRPNENHPRENRNMIANRKERFLEYCKVFSKEYNDDYARRYDINPSAVKNISELLNSPFDSADVDYDTGDSKNVLKDTTSKEMSKKLLGYYRRKKR